MSENTARISFVTEKKKKKKLEFIASQADRNLSYIINEALDNYLEIHSWQIEHINHAIQEADEGKFASEDDISTFFDQHGA